MLTAKIKKLSVHKMNKSMPSGYLYVAMDGDNAGSQVEKAALKNDIKAIKDISDRIKNGSEAVRARAESKYGAETIIFGGDDLGFLIPKSKATRGMFEDLRAIYKETAKFTITAGVAESIPKATEALLYGKAHGKNKTVFWTKEITEYIDKLKEKKLTPEQKILESGVLEKADVLAKGAMKRIHGKYNSTDPKLLDYTDAIHSWVNSGWSPENQDDRRAVVEDFENRPGKENEMARALHKLHSHAMVRKNPETGEREFLLHRGVASKEKMSAHMGSHIAHNSPTSWTPKYDVAHSLALEYQDSPGPNSMDEAHDNVLSAWIPENKIASIPNQVASENEHKYEHEVIVKPHLSQKADDKIQAGFKNEHTQNLKELRAKVSNDPAKINAARKERIKSRLFQKSATLEDKIKNKLNLIRKEDVLAKAYKNKQLNTKQYEAFDDSALGPHNADPTWSHHNSDVFTGLQPAKDLEPGIGGPKRTTKVMRVVGGQENKKAIIKAPLDWRELGLVYDNKHPAYERDMDNYRKAYKDWATKKNSALSSGESFHESAPQRPHTHSLKRLSETSGFLHPNFRSTHREVAFDFLANNVFGLGQNVARTGLFIHPKTKQPWSAQEYIEGGRVENPSQLRHHENAGDLHKLAAMDVILGNNDRHLGNMKFDKNNRLKLIDNAGAFDYSNRITTTDYPRYVSHLVGYEAPQNFHRWLNNIDENNFKHHLQRANVPDFLSNIAMQRLGAMKQWSRMQMANPSYSKDFAGALDLAKIHRLDLNSAFLHGARQALKDRIKAGQPTQMPAKSGDESTLKLDPPKANKIK